MQKWMIPCNVKNFNIIEHFSNETTAFFKRNRALTLGDEVYIYVARPFSEIKYKGEIIKTGIQPNAVDKKYGVSCLDTKTFVEVKLTQVFPDNTFPGAILKEHGLGQVVNQQLIRGEIESYIDSVESKL